MVNSDRNSGMCEWWLVPRFLSTTLLNQSRSEKSAQPAFRVPQNGPLARFGLRLVNGLWPYRSRRGGLVFRPKRMFSPNCTGPVAPHLNLAPPTTRVVGLARLSAPNP